MVELIKRKVTPQRAEQIKNILLTLCITMAILMIPTIIYADPTTPGLSTGASDINSKFTTLRDLISAVVSSIGGIVVLWGFFEIGTSMQSQDGSMQSAAFKRVGGGLLMVMAPQLVVALL